MPGLVDAFELIGEAAEHHLPQTHAAGLALAVTDAEETLGVVVRGFADVAARAPVRPETRFEIGSISKQLAAIVALQEVEAGRLDLHVSVNELLPWLELPEPFGPITLHHLLTHTSGLGIGMEAAPTALGAATELRHLPPTSAPGERFWYSNDGYKLVGLVLERVCGAPVDELLRERVLVPLGMGHSDAALTDATRLDLAVGYEPLHADRPPHLNHPLVPAPWLVSNTADGSVVSDVVDMAAYGRALLGGGATRVDGHEVRVLGEDAFATLVTPYVETGERDERYGYGVDVFSRDGRAFVGHSGGMVGYTALLWVDRDAGLACVALQNGDGEKRDLVGYAIDAVRAAVAGMPAARAPHPPPPTAIAAAAELAGVYGGPRTIELTPTSDGLRLVDGAVGVALERLPDVDDAFLVPHPALDRHLLRVERDAEGRVAALGHGADRFTPAGRPAAAGSPHPTAWDAYPGVYRSTNAWGPVVRVLLRGGTLRIATGLTGWVDRPLVPLDGGTFAIEEAWRPERVRFDRVVEGHAARVTVAGAPFYRSFEG